MNGFTEGFRAGLKAALNQRRIAAIVVLVFGCISQAFGVDIAPEVVDATVTIVAAVVAVL